MISELADPNSINSILCILKVKYNVTKAIIDLYL